MDLEQIIHENPKKYLLTCCLGIYAISAVVPRGFGPYDFVVDAMLCTIMYALASVLQYKAIGAWVMSLQVVYIIAGLLSAIDAYSMYNMVLQFYDYYDLVLKVGAVLEFGIIVFYGASVNGFKRGVASGLVLLRGLGNAVIELCYRYKRLAKSSFPQIKGLV